MGKLCNINEIRIKKKDKFSCYQQNSADIFIMVFFPLKILMLCTAGLRNHSNFLEMPGGNSSLILFSLLEFKVVNIELSFDSCYLYQMF